MRGRLSALLYIGLLGIAACTAAGCSRETMNAQIAESIGTLGMYENNEPVETPKMKAQKEIAAQKTKVEQEVSGYLDRAARLAASYDYEKALDELALIDEDNQDDDRVISAKIEYQRLQNQLVGYGGDIAHLSVKSLVVDKSLAFDDDDMSSYYNYWYLTTGEFEKILESLYARNYILIDVHDVTNLIENEDGTVSFAFQNPTVPKGKTPIVLSFTEANYYDHMEGNGFSSRMVLDENGLVKNEYIDADGNTLVGAYDVVPILDEFVEKHPDFSFCGAKGIISVTGYEGVFGYGIETGGSTIRAIADSLKQNGWLIASQSYANESLENGQDYDTMAADMDEWKEKVGSLVGDTDLLIYPYGDQVSPGTLKQQYLLDAGYQFFFGIWTTAEFLEVNSDYVRQTRRTIDGYDLYLYGDTMTDFFSAAEILDPERPPFE